MGPPPSVSPGITRHQNPGHWAGVFSSKPSGFVIHGSRSGVVTRSRQQEYDGTRTYAENSLVTLPDGTTYYTGWNATIGDLQWSRHFDADKWGHHAGVDGVTRMGFEFAQAVISWNVTDGQVAAWADCYKSYVVPRWGEYNLRATGVLSMHSQLPQGIRDGKTDVFSRDDYARWNDLKARLTAAVGQ